MNIPAWLYWTIVTLYVINLIMTACTPGPPVRRGVGVGVASLFLVLLLATASRP